MTTGRLSILGSLLCLVAGGAGISPECTTLSDTKSGSMSTTFRQNTSLLIVKPRKTAKTTVNLNSEGDLASIMAQISSAAAFSKSIDSLLVLGLTERYANVNWSTDADEGALDKLNTISRSFNDVQLDVPRPGSVITFAQHPADVVLFIGSLVRIFLGMTANYMSLTLAISSGIISKAKQYRWEAAKSASVPTPKPTIRAGARLLIVCCQTYSRTSLLNTDRPAIAALPV